MKDLHEEAGYTDIDDIIDDSIGADDPSKPALKKWAERHLREHLEVFAGPQLTVGELQLHINLVYDGYQLGKRVN